MDRDEWAGGRRRFLRGAGTASLLGLAGCQSSLQPPTGEDRTDAGPPTVAGEWVDAVSTAAESLNWLFVADEPSDARINLTLDGAYTVTPDQDVFPLWCTIDSADKRVYEVTLRENLRWSEPYGQMTAEDWVYTITEIFQGEDNWAGYARPGDWRQGEEPIEVEQTGRYTFELRLPSVDPAFPLKPVLWGQYVAPKELVRPYVEDRDVEGLQTDETLNTLDYTGNLGPYTFERWERQAEFVVTRNEDYYMRDVEAAPDAWREAPYFERYTVRVIPEEATRLAALRSGEVTHATIPETQVAQFEERPDVTVNAAPRAANTLLVYNQRANGWPPFRKRAVRRALAKAVDKEAIVKNVLRGHGAVAHTFQPQWSKWYSDAAVLETGVGESYDPDEAKSELERALTDTAYGYDGETVADETGTPVSLSLVYPVGSQATRTAAEFIAQEYGEVGLDVSLTGVQFSTLLGQYMQTTDAPPRDEAAWYAGPYNAGNRDEATTREPWDLQYGNPFNTFPLTPTSTRPLWTTRGAQNYFGHYPEADLASLYDRAARETDAERRRDLLGRIFAALSEEQPGNFIHFGAALDGYQSEVSGPSEEWAYEWDSQTWHVE
jgi:peptide/nickel transport system substrate-binding protein